LYASARVERASRSYTEVAGVSSVASGDGGAVSAAVDRRPAVRERLHDGVEGDA
jgi:hypothetical protein